jgi:hypothetical protein
MGDTKLLIDEGSTMVKIEVNTVLRGTVHSCTQPLSTSWRSWLFPSFPKRNYTVASSWRPWTASTRGPFRCPLLVRSRGTHGRHARMLRPLSVRT